MRNLSLVFLGGCLGTLLRWGLAHLNTGLPWGTMAVNLIGAFCLGALAAWVTSERTVSAEADAEGKHCPHSKHFVGFVDAEQVRLFFGTGLIGSFTTYSAFSVEAVRLLDARPFAGVSYVLVMTLGGLTAAWLGGRAVRA